jgi:hypothetical protein
MSTASLEHADSTTRATSSGDTILTTAGNVSIVALDEKQSGTELSVGNDAAQEPLENGTSELSRSRLILIVFVLTLSLILAGLVRITLD